MLDVTPATLYAYVSRGLLHSIAASKGRARLYSLADLKRLQTRRDARRGHTAVAAAALDWGAPVLDSSITKIDAGGPHYRGQSAVELARAKRSFESVAELLWQGPAAWQADPLSAKVLASLSKLEVDPPSRLGRLIAYVAARAVADPDRHARAPQLERDRAAKLLHGMAGALEQLTAASDALCQPSDRPDSRRSNRQLDAQRAAEARRKAGAPRSARDAGVAARKLAEPDRSAPATGDAASRPGSELAFLVASALGVGGSPRVVAAIDQMLVLCADHELNVSTFAVRVTASAGADLYACVTAGLCALSGGSHGGICDRVELLAEACRLEALSVDSAERRGAPRHAKAGPPSRVERRGRSSKASHPENPRRVGRAQREESPRRADDLRRAAERLVRARLAAGESVPGFGQPLYPEGDPRGLLLLELAQSYPARAPRLQTILGIRDAMSAAGRHDPTLDLGLCALSGALELPLGAASAIFALGRVAGWVAHTLEQRERPVLLRPRARYVGPEPR